MSKIDLAQLIKILNMTQSDSDNEALTALRIAQSHIKKAGESWESLLGPKKQHKSAFKDISGSYDPRFWRAVVECKEFTSLLNQDQVDWFNKVIRFENKHRFIPDDIWEHVRDFWTNFREKR